MDSPISIRPSPEEKLALLRRIDEFRYWHTLEDCRLCERCQHVINGRQIEVHALPRSPGVFTISCPTPDCSSTPADWTYLDPVKAALAFSSAAALPVEILFPLDRDGIGKSAGKDGHDGVDGGGHGAEGHDGSREIKVLKRGLVYQIRRRMKSAHRRTDESTGISLSPAQS